MDIQLTTPPDFNFRRTVLSHGWYGLLPFELERETWTLTRVFTLDGGAPVTATIGEGVGGVLIRTRGRLSARSAAQLAQGVRHILRLDDDMTEFYRVMRDEPDFRWIVAQGAGRLLRSPTVYEDLVKSICTTNCSWALTVVMVTRLVTRLGAEARDGRRAFPSPADMAAAPVEFYREEVRAGYRAAYLKELAERVASGELDVESWLTSPLSTPELKREMKRVKGVGDYAAENLLKLVGRYDVLALDSWLRAKFARTHREGRATSDAHITRYYARFRAWRGLAIWCDMTRDWIEEERAVDGSQ